MAGYAGRAVWWLGGEVGKYFFDPVQGGGDPREGDRVGGGERQVLQLRNSGYEPVRVVCTPGGPTPTLVTASGGGPAVHRRDHRASLLA